MRISDWSSDVCSSDLAFRPGAAARKASEPRHLDPAAPALYRAAQSAPDRADEAPPRGRGRSADRRGYPAVDQRDRDRAQEFGVVRRSEEHTSELQSLMRISYAVF